MLRALLSSSAALCCMCAARTHCIAIVCSTGVRYCRLWVQGNCASNVPSDMPSLGATLRSRQCVLLAQQRVLQPRSSPNVTLWLDNLYLRAMPNEAASRVSLIGWTIVKGADPSLDTRLWLTNSTLEGDNRNSSCLFVYGMSAYAGGASTPSAAVLHWCSHTRCSLRPSVTVCSLHLRLHKSIITSGGVTVQHTCHEQRAFV